ncbi:Transposase [Limihaloglobus sulfuriphilus]|uniref:Transposase n=1 Tax=Limihaloglobus sulfuriphilus TaxID=1851148 RepID=A0A1R7T636_9BACT|nr:transposase [Limihaloglobus sulfuriphilus]AQQ72246.1 Transposase [Limihaloglobus sulfuriphilus]
MPRKARIVLTGQPHHITQRGNNRQDVFFVDDDWKVYLELLGEQSEKFGLDILCYCLMTNHIHIIAIPQASDSLAKAVGRTHLLYTQYINRMHRRSGHLWQNRFYSCVLDGRHLWKAMRYVEQNPVRARMVRKAGDYPYSSAKAHLENSDPAQVLDMRWWRDKRGSRNWRGLLEEKLDKDYIARLRLSTSRGRPLVTDSFLSKMEKIAGRRLRPLPVGRPKRTKKKDKGVKK